MQPKFRRCFLSACLALACFSAGNPALAGDREVGAVFLNDPVGPRPCALGEAFTAVAEDANAVFWNPAGLVRVPAFELQAMHTEALQGFQDEYFALTLPLSAQDALGCNGFFSYIGQLEKIQAPGDVPSAFMAYDAYLGFSWARAFDRCWSASLTLKGVYQAIDTYTAWTGALDLGFLANDLLPHLAVGLTVRNFGPPLRFISKSSPLPLTAEIGAGYDLWNRSLRLTCALDKPWEQEMVFKAGVEYSLEELIFFRAGYKYSQFGNDLGPLAGLTCGLGLQISDYVVDYAFAPCGDLGNIHRISITLPFGRSVVDEEKIISRLEKQIKQRQENIIQGYVQKGDQLFKHGEYQQAIAYYEKALAINPNYSYLKKQINQAAVRYKKITAERHYQIGLKSYRNQEYLAALIEWNKVLEIMPEYPRLDEMLEQVNRKLTAEKNSHAASKAAQESDALFAKGLDLLKSGQYQKAIDTWRQQLALTPNDTRVKNYLEKARQKMNEEIADLLQQGRGLWQGGDWVGAAGRWRQVLKIDPENKEALDQLTANQMKIRNTANELYLTGVQNYIQNKLIEAMANWKDVLVLDPDNHKAKKHLERAKEKIKEIETIQE